MKKICYVGVRQLSGRPEVFVEETEDGITTSTLLDPRPSLKLWRHSPTGFEWGYGGSGPAQLALAILLHAAENHYGLEPGSAWRPCVCPEIDPADRPCITCEGRASYRKEGREKAVELHQTFKWSHVSRFFRAGFRLRLEEVLEVLK